MNRKGEITSTEIALLTLAIVGLIILGYAVSGILNNKDLANRDTCRLSILARATVPDTAQAAIPLNCQTEKICITTKDKPTEDEPTLSPFAILGDKKSDCKQFAGEENVRDIYVKINNDSKDQKETRNTIEKEYAYAMFNCWAMTGQGKLDVFRGEGGLVANIASDLTDLDQVIKNVAPKCIVCSRIAISDKVYAADKYGVLAGLDFNEYLRTERVPNTQLSYLDTFTDGSVNSYAGVDQTNAENNELARPSLQSDQIAMVFMQIKTDMSPSKAALESAILAGGVVVGGGGILSGLGVTAISKSPLYYILGGLAVGGAIYQGVTIASQNQALSLASCSNYAPNDETAKLGCTLIKPVNWNVNEVNALCKGGIEGNL